MDYQAITTKFTLEEVNLFLESLRVDNYNEFRKKVAMAMDCRMELRNIKNSSLCHFIAYYWDYLNLHNGV